MGLECFSSILILSQRKDIIELLLDIFKNKNLYYIDISQNIQDITTDYCLIIIGPDIDSNLVYQRIKELKGISPYFLFLENESNSNKPIYISCKCKKIYLPMEILTIEEQLEELLEIHYG